MKRGDLILFVFSGILMLSSFSVLGREPLTFEQRVKAQEAIEKVYYNHRIWPKENKSPKPAFEKMVSKETIENKVTDYLKKSAALEKYWYRPITGEQLQAEMDRMAKGTKDPRTLNELFSALNNDPYLIAECLARPVLADRLVRNWYANDERFHKETRTKAEEIRKKLTTENFCESPEGQYSKMTYKLEIEGREEREVLDPEDHSIGLSEKEFEKMFQEIPEEGKISGVIEKDDCFVILHTVEKNEGEIEIESLSFLKVSVQDWSNQQLQHQDLYVPITIYREFVTISEEGSCGGKWEATDMYNVAEARQNHVAVWTGTEMIVWGGTTGFEDLTSGARYNPSTDSWFQICVNPYCPESFNNCIGVWTGTEMLVYGNDRSSYEAFGGCYNINSDSWVAMNMTDAPNMCGTAVWTGTEMIVWGGSQGAKNIGGRYNPSTNIWLSTSITNAPTARRWHTSVWTGTEMIVWGGESDSGLVIDGGRYNPSTDAWAPISITNAPSSRIFHTAVWTGTEMIIWGGYYYSSGTHYQNTGGKYNPQTDTWTATATSGNVPSARYRHSAVWSGTYMIVWGGNLGVSYTLLNTGGRYNPITNSWEAVGMTNVPLAREFHSSIWTGSEMVVWGGNPLVRSGGRYNPATDSWVPTNNGGDVPSPRYNHFACWTGSEMLVWGGYGSSGLNTGGRYNPTVDIWVPTSTGTNVPVGRWGMTGIWSGSEMIIWGGFNNDDALNDGGRYYPVSDTWQSVSLINVPSARWGHSAVWTGTEMIIWGGGINYSGIYFNTGGRYNPTSNSWVTTSVSISTPIARSYHSAIWAESLMIVWGGESNVYHNTGGKYNPLTDSWSPISNGTNVPHALSGDVAKWTGTEMLIWGSSNYPGGKYNPISDSWLPISQGENSPLATSGSSLTWTGSEMIVWGGGYDWHNINSGSKYNPLTDSWILLPETGPVPTPRSEAKAVWTGEKMIIWGGTTTSFSLQSGGIYDPYGLMLPPILGLSYNMCPSYSASISIPAFYVSYQWNLNGTPISGATSSTYEATVSGSYTVSVTDLNGCSGTSDPHSVTIEPCIPDIVYSSHGAFTELTGDGDSYFEKGELWSVPVTVTNSGNTPATNVTAVFSGNGITVCNPTGSFGTIAAGGTGTFTYSFVIDDDFTPCGGNINFNLGSKTSTELTPAGTDETNLFSIQVGQITAGSPTNLVLQPSSADSYVNQASAGTNYGSGVTMSVQSRLSQAQRTLVMFDLSGIPEDSVVNSATLELYASSAPTTGLTLNVHRITATWTEAAVTWTNQPAYNSTVDASLAGGTTTGWKMWNIASLVQDWVDGTSDNYGLIVKGSVENDKTAVTYAFASKENGTSENRPILRINYTPPTTMNCDYVGPGECDAVLTECAPGDTYENGQTWSGTSQSWPALTGATGYKLYRGIQSGLPNLLTADPDSCLRYEGSSTSIDLSADDPSSEIGRLYWYIVSGTNGSGEGPAGNGRIVNSSGICE